ncbi:MAG: hypothetical protein R3C27_12160 [Hyphomonadaceae bacterium]
MRAEGYKARPIPHHDSALEGADARAESSISKSHQRQSDDGHRQHGDRSQDHYGIINDPDLAPLEGAFHQSYMFAPGLRIAGGTGEILKNIIFERVLGLPQDVRVDKGVAFKDLPSGR